MLIQSNFIGSVNSTRYWIKSSNTAQGNKKTQSDQLLLSKKIYLLRQQAGWYSFFFWLLTFAISVLHFSWEFAKQELLPHYTSFLQLLISGVQLLQFSQFSCLKYSSARSLTFLGTNYTATLIRKCLISANAAFHLPWVQLIFLFKSLIQLPISPWSTQKLTSSR